MLPKGHYIHFRINGKMSEIEYERIKKLPYNEQIARLMAASDFIEVSADTKIELLVSEPEDEPG